MTTVLALLLLIADAAALEPTPAVLHGGRAAPRAWLASVRAALWICWDDGARRGPPDPDCWQRVDLPAGGADPRELRASFLDAATVVVRDADERTFQLVRGEPTLQSADIAALDVEPRERLTAIPCSPSGHVPIYIRGRWSWIMAPCAAPAGPCVAPPALPALRRPSELALSFSVEVRAEDRRELATAVQASTTTSVIASVRVGFDPARWFGRQIAWHELQSARRPRVRDLPPLRSTGPLAERERDALVAVVCGGGQVR